MNAHEVQQSLQVTAEEAVKTARTLGADQVEAGVSYGEGLRVR